MPRLEGFGFFFTLNSLLLMHELICRMQSTLAALSHHEAIRQVYLLTTHIRSDTRSVFILTE
jgi:hypothetical protein